MASDSYLCISSKFSHKLNYWTNKDSLKMDKIRLYLQKKLYRGTHYTQSIPQCYRWWKIGYTAHLCKNSPLCKQCTSNQNSTTCTTPTANPIKCCICITHEKTASKTPVNTLEERYTHPHGQKPAHKWNKMSKAKRNAIGKPNLDPLSLLPCHFILLSTC